MIYLALLRGINVGGNALIDMRQLQSSFENLGLDKVTTYINTGNVIFESGSNDQKQLIDQIEYVIKQDFQLEIKVVLRDINNLKMLCEQVPTEWSNDKIMKTDVLFLWEVIDSPNIIDAIISNPAVDNLIYTDGAVIWNINRENYNSSGMAKLVRTKLYKLMTVRNINTTRKVLALMQAM